MSIESNCLSMTVVMPEVEDGLRFSILNEGFVFQGRVIDTPWNTKLTTYVKPRPSEACPPWYGVTRKLALLTADARETIGTLQTKYKPVLAFKNDQLTWPSIQTIIDFIPHITEKPVHGLVTTNPKRLILFNRVAKEAVVRLETPPRCTVVPSGARLHLDRISEEQRDMILGYAETLCGPHSKLFYPWEASKEFLTKLSSRPTPYTLLSNNSISKTISVEHLVPLVLWMPITGFLLERDPKYAMNAFRDIYNMALEDSAVNHVRSSIPFGSVTTLSESKEEPLVLLIKNLRYDIRGREKSEVREWVETYLKRNGMRRDTSLDLNDPQVCASILPTSLTHRETKSFIFCTDDPCTWEPPDEAKGWIARACLWVLTVHWVAPYLRRHLYVRKEGLVWIERVLIRLIGWDNFHPIISKGKNKSPEVGWSKQLAKLCGYTNAFVEHRKTNNTSLGQVLFTI